MIPISVWMCQKQKIFPSISGGKALRLITPLFTAKLPNLLIIINTLELQLIIMLNSAKTVTSCSERANNDYIFLENSHLLTIDQTILTLFYRSFIQSVLTVSIICWCGNLSVSDKSKLQKLVNICSKIRGQQQPSLANVYYRQVLKKAKQYSVSVFWAWSFTIKES